MSEYRQILFPVDLSDAAAKIVPHVRTMVDKFNSRLHLLFVARVFEYFTGLYVPPPSITDFEKQVVAGAEKRLYEFAEEHFSDVAHTKTIVVSGDPAESILGYIESAHIDLVIMGTHGRKGLDKIIFGSVADQIVKTCAVPVMVVNPHKVGQRPAAGVA
jgi:nucleotide-binding universal stress UspA family protein